MIALEQLAGGMGDNGRKGRGRVTGRRTRQQDDRAAQRGRLVEVARSRRPTRRSRSTLHPAPAGSRGGHGTYEPRGAMPPGKDGKGDGKNGKDETDFLPWVILGAGVLLLLGGDLFF